MKKNKKTKQRGKYQQSTESKGGGRNTEHKINQGGGRKGGERANLYWGLCHPSPRRTDSAAVFHSVFFFLLVYFCDAWFVCHHPISKHNTHPQSSSSSSSPAGIWRRTKRNTVNWPLCVRVRVCLCVCVGGGGGLACAGVESGGGKRIVQNTFDTHVNWLLTCRRTRFVSRPSDFPGIKKKKKRAELKLHMRVRT